MKTRWKYVLLVATVGVAVASLLVARSHSFRVAYHKRQMQRAHDETFGGNPDIQDGLAGFTLGESYERYEYHRQQLVELGAVRELRYELRHILVPTEESRDFYRRLQSANRPDYIDFISPHPREPKPMELTIWCLPEDAPEWDAFIEKHDVPDYRARFMSEAPAETAVE